MFPLVRRYKYALLIGGVAAFAVVGYFGVDRVKATTAVFERPELTLEQVVAAEVEKSDPNELLPDLVPLPAQDLQLQKVESGDLHLLFSTTYFNQGRGNLELRADPATAGIRADIERDVLQRVYFANGGHRDKVVGHFLWHQEHLHYHYADFVVYDLTSVDNPNHPDLTGILQKSTFCLRDISKVLADIPGAKSKEDISYKICGKELQGVSVGWGDTYYYNYPDQALDVTSLETGTYKLTFIVNPEKRLDETAYANNTSSVTFKLDRENQTVTVLEEVPNNLPKVEHIFLEDPMGINPW